MLIILKQDIKGVGRKYEIKEVAQGYANNFLIPKKLAEYAGPGVVKKLQVIRAQEKAEIEIREKLIEKQVEMLKDVKITLKKKTNEKGHLFEKIHTEEIFQALKDQGHIEIDPEFLTTENPIKEIGEHNVSVSVGKNEAKFTLNVEAI